MATMSKSAKSRRRTTPAAGSRRRTAKEQRDWRRNVQVVVVWVMVLGLIAAIAAVGVLSVAHH
jgi:preprotein translocase subunit Sec63